MHEIGIISYVRSGNTGLIILITSHMTNPDQDLHFPLESRVKFAMFLEPAGPKITGKLMELLCRIDRDEQCLAHNNDEN